MEAFFGSVGIHVHAFQMRIDLLIKNSTLLILFFVVGETQFFYIIKRFQDGVLAKKFYRNFYFNFLRK